MLRRFLDWLARPARRPPRSRRSRLGGCLFWVLILIGVLIVLALFFGGYQKGTKAGGLPRTQTAALPATGPAGQRMGGSTWPVASTLRNGSPRWASRSSIMRIVKPSGRSVSSSSSSHSMGADTGAPGVARGL